MSLPPDTSFLQKNWKIGIVLASSRIQWGLPWADPQNWLEALVWGLVRVLQTPADWDLAKIPSLNPGRSPYLVSNLSPEDQAEVSLQYQTHDCIAIFQTPTKATLESSYFDPRRFILPSIILSEEMIWPEEQQEDEDHFRVRYLEERDSPIMPLGLSEQVREEYSLAGRLNHSHVEEYFRNHPPARPLWTTFGGEGFWDCTSWGVT